jgi:cytoskeleton protein RodZ
MDQAREAVPEDSGHDQGGHDDGTGMPDGAVPPSRPVAVPLTVSQRLRAGREAQGLTTADIAARTRITLRHVEALDRGDLAALPGRPYVLGFVRNYARAVGLNEAELADLARREMDANLPRVAPRTLHQFDVDDPAKTPSRLVTWLALALTVAILVAGGVFWRSYYAPGAALPSLDQADASPSATPAAAHPAPAPAPAPNGPVVFTARQDRIWVKFYDGHGQQLLQKQLALGETYTVPADAFQPRLWTGRPDALTITIGGQQVPPLADKQTIMRDVPVTAQALLARGQANPAPAPAPSAGTVAPAPVAPAPVALSGPAPSLPHPAHHRPHPVHADAPAAADESPAPVPSAAAAIQ